MACNLIRARSSQSFYDRQQSVKHVADVALESGMNNSIERMHGSIRERETVMRGLKSMETPFIERNRIYYNFIRPHMGLEGETPAEAAGIGVKVVGVNAGQEMHNYGGMKVLRSINTYLVQVSLSPSLSSCVELSLDVFVP